MTPDDIVKIRAHGQTISFQDRVADWMLECFGPMEDIDKPERVHRFIEEACELAQALGVTEAQVRKIAAYVFSRPVETQPAKEVGGVRVTLAAVCLAYGFDEASDGEIELERAWGKIDRIARRDAEKPKFSVPSCLNCGMRTEVDCERCPACAPVSFGRVFQPVKPGTAPAPSIAED